MAIHGNPPALISISQIVAEFGGSAPHSLSEYIRGGNYVPNNSYNSAIPTSNNQISLSKYYNASLYTPGSILYTTPASYTFTVPAGVSVLTVRIVGGGGGGGGCSGCGDNHAGGGGGSGGLRDVSISVSPGNQYSVIVGAGGQNARVHFCADVFYNNGSYTGTSGGTSSFGAYTATGGAGGTSSDSDSCIATSGAGGSPGGVAGGSIDCNRNSYNATIGGSNGTSYGRGGNSHYNSGGFVNGTYGGNGMVSITW